LLGLLSWCVAIRDRLAVESLTKVGPVVAGQMAGERLHRLVGLLVEDRLDDLLVLVIADAVRVVVPAPAVDNADFDQNNRVDALDFLAWQRGSGTMGGATPADGDANDDGNVDGLDLAIWETQYGTPVTVAAVQSLQQPAAVQASAPDSPKPLSSFSSSVVEEELEQQSAIIAESRASNDYSSLADVVRMLTLHRATAEARVSHLDWRATVQACAERTVDRAFDAGFEIEAIEVSESLTEFASEHTDEVLSLDELFSGLAKPVRKARWFGNR